MNNISELQTDKTDIANAIITKGGTVNSGDGFDNFATDILTIPTNFSEYEIGKYYSMAYHGVQSPPSTTLVQNLADLDVGKADWCLVYMYDDYGGYTKYEVRTPSTPGRYLVYWCHTPGKYYLNENTKIIGVNTSSIVSHFSTYTFLIQRLS